GLAAEPPQFLEQKRRGDDGWPGIERKAVLPKHAGPPTRLLQPVDDGDAKAAHAEADGGGEPSESGPDDDGVGRVVGDGQRRGAGVQARVRAVDEAVDPIHKKGIRLSGHAKRGESEGTLHTPVPLLRSTARARLPMSLRLAF